MTPTLSRLFPLSRLALLRRAPFWAQALALCALFAIAGVAVLDDYGVGWDAGTQRQIASANADYIISGNVDGLYRKDFRYYGVAFEMPLLLLERALGLRDSRDIYLTRHLITHLLFIAGGFACGLLAYRMLGSRWIALFAMLLFLLHPRLYAHSFLNSKDVPFAAMLIIALYLAHRAFRKDTIGAFLLCGIAVGLAINLRPFALMLLPMIPAMRAPDLWRAGKAERKRVLLVSAAFLAAALATAYIAHPYYWENPLRLIESVRALSQHPNLVGNLFMGEIYRSDAVPWNYIPAWFAITSPPVALPLGALGAAAVCWQGVSRPLAALRDRETRFRVLPLSCFALPVAVAITLQFNIYGGWRHMYFLWGPFCLLAAVGLHSITNISVERGIWKKLPLPPGWVRGGSRLHIARQALAYGVAGFGLITTLTAMAALHPHEYVYFNALTDAKTPDALAERYHLDYWHMSYLEAYRHLLARYPDDTLRVYPQSHAAQILSQNDRKRIAHTHPNGADFYVHSHVNRRHLPDLPVFHSIQIYGSRMGYIYAPNSDAYRRAYHAAYSDAESNGTLIARSDFDIYIHNGELRYLNANCAPLRTNSIEDIVRVFLHIFPANPADLPADSRERGFENMDFYPHTHLTFIDGKCIYKQPLPDYAIERIRTGEHLNGETIWRADINLVAHAAAQAVHDDIAAGDYGPPAAQSDFDVYLRGNVLIYLKEPCAPSDADVGFFLHIFPADPADLPADRREFGFANLGFQFTDRGAYAGDICVATLELPDYPLARIRTGQNATTPGGNGWRADIDLAAHAAAQALYESILDGDYGPIVAQSRFDIYLSGNALTYLKAPCAEGDTHARFFLHITPSDPAALPAPTRERGFANLDFHFADHGVHAGDICVASLDLPDYPIHRIRTGQFVSGEGALWRAEFPAAQ